MSKKPEECQMCTSLINYLWLKGIIPTQQYENFFYKDHARDLKDKKHLKYKLLLNNYKKNNIIND